MALKKKSQSRKAAPKAAVKSRTRPSKKALSKAARFAGIRKAALLATVLALFVAMCSAGVAIVRDDPSDPWRDSRGIG